MTGAVMVCGVFAIVLFLLLWIVPVQRKVMRRFRQSMLLLRWVRGVSLLVALLAAVTCIWFHDNNVMASITIGVTVMSLIIGVTAIDRLRLMTQPALNRRVYLLVSAHPGDTIYGCGGTMASLWDNGHSIRGITVTNGHDGEDVDLLPRRTREWARFLGCHSITLGNIPVERVEQDYDAILSLIGEHIQKYEPDVILTHSPHDSDPVRQVVSQAVLKMTHGRHAVFGFSSATSTDEFRPAQARDIADYTEMKNIIMGHYHEDWDRRDARELFEVLRPGRDVPPLGCPVSDTLSPSSRD